MRRLGLLLVGTALALVGGASAGARRENGRILFQSFRGEAIAYPSLYAVPLAGGKRVLVTRHADAPAASRDGRRLAFVRDRSVVVLELAHPRRQRVLVRRAPRFNDVEELSWSPAGDAVSYVIARAGSHRTLWVKRLASRGAQRIAELDPNNDDPAHATWSPDGASLAFATIDGYVGDEPRSHVRIANLITGGVRRVPGTAGAEEPAWSPDGRNIAFTVPGPEDAVVLVRPNGTHRQRVAEGSAPLWSPRGDSLAIGGCGGSPGLTILSVAGHTRRCLTHRRFTGSWSATGTSLVGWEQEDSVAVVVLDAARGRRRVLARTTGDFALHGPPVALRQPARIVFAAVDHPQGRTGLFTVEPDGRDVKPLGSLHPLWAVWSPDGSRMAVQLERKIVLADARAQVQRPLADGGEPSWSPGGREIAFETGGPALTAVIVIMDVDTGEQRELGPGTHPSWAPDGERVVAARNDGALWVYRLDGGPAERLTDVRDDASPCPVSATQPAWSPDGATIAYVDDGCSSFVLRFLDVASRTTLPYRGNNDALEPEEVAPAWSPDGRYVVYQQGGFSEWGKIAVVRADGSGYRVLYAGPGESTSPSWAPR